MQAQQAPMLGEAVVMQLEESVRKGHKRSLRDLGSLLDRGQQGTMALEVLRRYTVFSPEEIDLSGAVSKSTFLDFYYEYQQDISFSDLTGTFYLSPLSDRKTNAKVKMLKQHASLRRNNALSQLHQTEQAIQEAIDKGDDKKLGKLIRSLQDIQIPEVQSFVLLLANQLDSNNKQWSKEVYLALCNALIYEPDIGNLHKVLSYLSENKIYVEDALRPLAMISNVSFEVQQTKEQVIKNYHYLIDSLGNLDNIRMYGYERLFTFRPSFFDNMVDYYARVLCFANDREWLVHNAIRDMIRTTHPRMLYYLAAIGFKNEYQYPSLSFDFAKAEKTIRQSTGISLAIKNVEGKVIFSHEEKADRYAAIEYLSYWAAHYGDYEWDSSRDIFVNKHQALEKTQHYERLFRRLNSRNDSVAMASFIQLTEGDPTEIVALANKYRQMFRTYNHSLPPFKYKYLEQLSELTQFCRIHNINYRAKPKLKTFLNRLSQCSDQAMRYALENKIIQQLQLDEVTAVEYWACLHPLNPENAFSIGRILDIFYSKYWQQIIHDKKQLRLYLKKAGLFKNIGVIGVCNNYLNKFDISQKSIIAQLQDLSKEETDGHILNQIAQLIQFSESEESISLNDFFSTPMYFDKRDIKILPPPSLDEYQQVIQLIEAEEENSIIGKFFFYLRLHPNIEAVPYLMKLAANDRVLAKRRGKVVTLGDQVTPILESIYNYSFPLTRDDKIFDISPWLQKWNRDKDNFRLWAKAFFEEKMKFLEQEEELSIEDINLITESPNYDSTYKDFCLRALKKVKPVKSIRSLVIEPKLRVQSDLKYFQDFEFSYKHLDDIPKLFEIDDPGAMLKYLIKKADFFDLEEKGAFYNNMFRHPWFAAYINSGSADLVAVAYIQQVLEEYLNESEFLSEYEEQITTLHIAQVQNIGKPLEEQLLAPFDLDADVSAIAKIQESIIATIAYQDIGIVAKHFDKLCTTLGKAPWAFLRRDFGIPVFDLMDKEKYIAFRRHLNNDTEYELYLHYLKEFGLDFLTKKGELDFDKIANILRFDAVSPFISKGGGRRDYLTYGIIKLLELNFGTRLGFHEKLNENQTFYTFTTDKRAKAWLHFLMDRNLIENNTKEAPSFNQILE